jgi:hypothetical protein
LRVRVCARPDRHAHLVHLLRHHARRGARHDV